MCGIIDKEDIKKILKENLVIQLKQGQADTSASTTSIEVYFDKELISESTNGDSIVT